MDEIQESIDRFFGYFDDHLDSVSGVTSPKHQRVFRKTLYLVIIDTLSKCRYPEENSNSKRFTDFVRGFANWPDCEKISLLQLRLHLDQQTNLNFPTISSYVSTQIDMWNEGSVYSAGKDPFHGELENVLNGCKQQEKDWIEKNLWYFSHLMLLWKYRNMLIHEGRSPGHGVEFEGDEDVLYTSTMDPCKWELIYPENFFHRIAKSCIVCLKNYCETNRLNPYDSYSFESSWILKKT